MLLRHLTSVEFGDFFYQFFDLNFPEYLQLFRIFLPLLLLLLSRHWYLRVLNQTYLLLHDVLVLFVQGSFLPVQPCILLSLLDLVLLFRHLYHLLVQSFVLFLRVFLVFLESLILPVAGLVLYYLNFFHLFLEHRGFQIQLVGDSLL